MVRVAAASAVAASCAALPASAQVQQLTPYYKVVQHGRSIKIASFGSFDPTCRPIGRTEVNLTSAPQGGTVETAYGLDFPQYQSTNVRFHCDSRKLPETILYYRAAPNFTGTDTFTVEIVFGDGEARQNRYTVYVR